MALDPYAVTSYGKSEDRKIGRSEDQKIRRSEDRKIGISEYWKYV